MSDMTRQRPPVPEPFGASLQQETLSPLMALSPLDGRYRGQTASLAPYYSEFALIRNRFHVEVEWLIMALSRLRLPDAPELSDAQIQTFRSWAAEFSLSDARRIKQIEASTRHDVKAVEYYLRQLLTDAGCAPFAPWVHICCTSEDINNIAHALMLREGLFDVWRPALDRAIAALVTLAQPHLGTAMLARTHGQPASPTTLGKELAVFVVRLRRQRAQLDKLTFMGKFSGAVGNFNAHVSAYPDVDWLCTAREFLAGFGLEMQPATTQIEPHDYMAEAFHLVIRVNSILIDLDRDMWSYISLGYLRQKLYPGEVGSSTMPHKINPIDFENSEANAGLSTAILEHLATKLPISRMQRDLSDSSAIRTVGTGIGHSLLALRGCLAGLDKVDVDAAEMTRDLDRNWAVLGEAIQTVMRKQGVEDAYEQIKAATQNNALDAAVLRSIVETAGIREPDRTYLLSLTPASFVGLAREIGEAALAETEY
jgi:adenylosuccinate lyase